MGVSVARGTVRLPAVPAPTADLAYARAAAALARAGLSAADAVQVTEYVMPGIGETSGFTPLT
ncbi:hypothetical protein ACWEPC_59595 [Nonomuraea sp. NPDC004297]